MFSLGGVREMNWWEKVTVQNCGRTLVKPKNIIWFECIGDVVLYVRSKFKQCKCNTLSRKLIALKPVVLTTWVAKRKTQPICRVMLAPWWLKWSTLYTVDVWAAKKKQQHWMQPAQTLASAWSRHSSLSHHREFTPATISLEWVDQSLGWKLIVQWCSYMLVALVWFCLMSDLERFP